MDYGIFKETYYVGSVCREWEFSKSESLDVVMRRYFSMTAGIDYYGGTVNSSYYDTGSSAGEGTLKEPAECWNNQLMKIGTSTRCGT